jgi:hypothetical protein
VLGGPEVAHLKFLRQTDGSAKLQKKNLILIWSIFFLNFEVQIFEYINKQFFLNWENNKI